MRKNKDFNPNNCPVTYCLNRIGGKWKPVIIHLIRKGCKQMLVNQLRELEDDNILQRVVYAEIPPRVEYTLTELGFSLLPVIEVMEQWGSSQMELSCEN